jgi:hypothetical protein
MRIDNLNLHALNTQTNSCQPKTSITNAVESHISGSNSIYSDTQTGALDRTRMCGATSASEDEESNIPLGQWARPTPRSVVAADEQPSPAPPAPSALTQHPATNFASEQLHLSFFASSIESAASATVISQIEVDTTPKVMQAEIESLQRQLAHAHRLLQSRSMARCEVATQTELNSPSEFAGGSPHRADSVARFGVGLDDTLSWEIAPTAVSQTPHRAAPVHHLLVETMLRAATPPSILADDDATNEVVGALSEPSATLRSSVGSTISNGNTSANRSHGSISASESAFESAKETPSPPRTLVRKMTMVVASSGSAAATDGSPPEPRLSMRTADTTRSPGKPANLMDDSLRRSYESKHYGSGTDSELTPIGRASPERTRFGQEFADAALSASYNSSVASILDTSACNSRADLIMQKYLGGDFQLSDCAVHGE